MATKQDKKTWTGAILLPIDSLVLTDWNVNEMSDKDFSELVAEVEEQGFDEPVGVVPTKDDPNSYLVLSGEHRVRACHALGIKEVPAVIKTALLEADEAALQMWSVRRNNIRGRINAQKYAALERGLSDRFKVSAEAARQRMLVKEDLLKAIQDKSERKSPSGLEDDDSDDTDRSGDDGTQAGKDAKAEVANRKQLLAALKNAEEEVLIKSADTVEHGYLFFGQGQGTHLVVNESKRLWGLVQRMIAACKAQSAPADDFLCAAIEAELGKWES